MFDGDKRRAPRHKVLMDGKIVTLNNWSVIDCCIRDYSSTGAKLRCQDQTAVPNNFRLLIPHDNSIREARVVWRRDDMLGVAFTSEPRRAPPRRW